MTTRTRKASDHAGKFRVTMRNVIPAGFDEAGTPLFHKHEAVDYVPRDDLDAYLADARLRWPTIEVSDHPEEN